jgi:hypothetical protein
MKSKSIGKSLSPSICRVCGDIARGVNFAALTCMPCKMFFRRHARSDLVSKTIYFFLCLLKQPFIFSLNRNVILMEHVKLAGKHESFVYHVDYNNVLKLEWIHN